MHTELDKVKSTITISLGTKNRLRMLKGGYSYENYINFLIKSLDDKKIQEKNYIEIQKVKRKTGVYSFETYKIIFSYNEYNKSDNFIFDILVVDVRKKGELISLMQCLNEISNKSNNNLLETEYRLFFILLTKAIQTDVDSLYEHKGSFEDYYIWKQELASLKISDKVYQNDVLEKLEQYKAGVHFYD